MIVRKSSDFHMSPQVYFTSEQLEEYMGIAIRKRWITDEVSTRVEAFAVAGSNVLSMIAHAIIGRIIRTDTPLSYAP